jgi:hypothetical protein
VQLAPDVDSARAPRDFDGVAVTYARVAADPRAWARSVARDALVIADEAHHLGEELTWGQAFSAAFAGAPRWLLLSGTPFRSDATPIPGVRYDADGLAVPDIAYTYAEAVRDGVCRPVGFVTYDGALSWRSGEDVIEASFEEALSAREAARRYRTAISAELPDGLARMLREADAKLEQVRAAGHRDAGGLVVATDGSHARALARLLHAESGVAPVVVLHTDTRAAAKLAAFTHSRERWIVAVNMVSEGVDIPRLRVGVYATAAKTPLVFRQIVGRFVRTSGPAAHERSWLYLPAEPLLRRHAGEIESELAPLLRRPDDESAAELFDEPAERRALREEALDFVPLRADVSPQMTLFGPPAGAAGPGPAARAPDVAGLSDGAGAPEGAGIAGEQAPAFERRAALRERRHRLVAELARHERSSHREVNAWLNHSVGVARVQDATLAQLERSVELLLRRLSRPRRAGVSGR